MADANKLVTEHIDVWTNAIKKRNSQGRGSSKKTELVGLKKLRELILELAVRGKLVPQNADDEPASVLLEKIAAKKTLLVKDNKIKKPSLFPKIDKEDIPFTEPAGWKFVRFAELAIRMGSGSTPRGGKSVYVESGTPFLRSQNVRNEGVDLSDVAYIDNKTHEKMSNTIVYPNDLLLNITGGSLGRSTIYPENIGEANVSQHVSIIRPFDELNVKFIHLCVLSPYIQGLIWSRQVGMAREGLSKKVMELFEFPLPPLAEQKRIVTKVDELMLLCDKLEQQTEESISAHQTLVEVLLTTLTNPTQTVSDTADTFQQNWQRIAENFDVLFTTEHSIEQLKQTILQLAVMGKLVPRNSKDEPASVLLEKIAKEKEQLIAAKKIKKQKSLPEITDEDKLFDLPSDWEWTRLGQVINLISGQHLKPDEYSNLAIEEGVPYITGPAEFGKSFPSYSKYTVEKRALAQKGDILITCKGAGLGKLNRANKTIAISRQLMAIQSILISEEYLYLLVDSQYQYFQNKGVGIAIPGISREDVLELATPLPPKEEQYRIVAKVDELMALCEQLKASLNNAQITQLQLAETIVAQVVN
jgi:type I restriction enzyme S subunit